MTPEAVKRVGPGLGRALGRALLRHCPRCGSPGLFRRWVAMAEDCPRCGLHFERISGYWVGAMALNLVVTEALFVVALVALLVATWPEVPWTTVLVVLAAMNLALPVVFHPVSRTTWVALERQLSRTWD